MPDGPITTQRGPRGPAAATCIAAEAAVALKSSHTSMYTLDEARCRDQEVTR